MIGDLPAPLFEPGRTYVVTGQILNAIIRAIRARTLIAGQNITLTEALEGGVIIAAAAGTAGLTGYITLYKQSIAGPGDFVAKLYVRLQNGSITTLLDGWDGAAVVTPPSEWGSELFYLNIPTVGALLTANENWSSL